MRTMLNRWPSIPQPSLVISASAWQPSLSGSASSLYRTLEELLHIFHRLSLMPHLFLKRDFLREGYLGVFN